MSEKQSIEVHLAKLNSEGLEDNLRKELTKTNNQVYTSISLFLHLSTYMKRFYTSQIDIMLYVQNQSLCLLANIL